MVFECLVRSLDPLSQMVSRTFAICTSATAIPLNSILLQLASRIIRFNASYRHPRPVCAHGFPPRTAAKHGNDFQGCRYIDVRSVSRKNEEPMKGIQFGILRLRQRHSVSHFCIRLQNHQNVSFLCPVR